MIISDTVSFHCLKYLFIKAWSNYKVADMLITDRLEITHIEINTGNSTVGLTLFSINDNDLGIVQNFFLDSVQQNN